MTISHHLLRRTARKRVEQLKRLQQEAEFEYGHSAKARLEAFGIGYATPLQVVKTDRGPFRYRVVAG